MECVTNSDLRIRDQRLRSGLSLTALAAASGVSMALLSQVERGLADPSLATLRKIAVALDVALFDLFETAPGHGTLRVQRSHEQLHVRLPDTVADYVRVSAGLGDLEVLRGSLPPHAFTSATLHAHGAEECVTVLTGTLTLEAEDKTIILHPEDSCHFRAHIPHRYVNNSESLTTFLVSVTPPSL